MSRKYISELLSQNFVYPNNTVPEYDLEIIHDINNYSVSGTVTTFTGVLTSPSSITINMSGTWSLNGAEPYINQSGTVNIFSVHMMGRTQTYYRPWSCVYEKSIATGSTTNSFSETFTVTPSMIGVTSFVAGTYYFEVRMIGHRAVYPICVTTSVTSGPTPTPSPSPTASGLGPTPTITGTLTPTPTVTGTLTPTPTSSSTPTPTPTGGATLSWTYTETNTDGEMYLYVNGNVVENRFSSSSGSLTVNVGDTINCEVIANGCTEPNIKANAYTISNRVQLVDAACANGNTAIFTSVYTVVSGDVGNTITLSMYSLCDTACV